MKTECQSERFLQILPSLKRLINLSPHLQSSAQAYLAGTFSYVSESTVGHDMDTHVNISLMCENSFRSHEFTHKTQGCMSPIQCTSHLKAM